MKLTCVPFGKTSINVTQIGLGLAAIGRPGYINLGHGADLNFSYSEAEMEARASEMLSFAFDQGIRYFDVARSYGKGEVFLSKWLNNIRESKEIVVGSKWGYTYTANWQVNAKVHEVKEHSIDVLNRQWTESGKLLGNNLKIYHIHSATLESGVLDNDEVLQKLWQLKDSGIIVGLSLSGPKQKDTLLKALTVKRGGESLFQSVQVTWNILEQSATEALKMASKEGFGIIVKEALANGRLTERNSSPVFQDKLGTLKQIATKYGASVDALSIAFVLHQEWVSTVLSGASTIDQLKSNLRSIEIKLSREDLEKLTKLADTSEIYWKERSGLEWN